VHLLIQLFPSAVTYLALVPGRTIPFAWNLITGGYVELTIPGVSSSPNHLFEASIFFFADLFVAMCGTS
jgi:hypothetical protein